MRSLAHGRVRSAALLTNLGGEPVHVVPLLGKPAGALALGLLPATIAGCVSHTARSNGAGERAVPSFSFVDAA